MKKKRQRSAESRHSVTHKSVSGQNRPAWWRGLLKLDPRLLSQHSADTFIQKCFIISDEKTFPRPSGCERVSGIWDRVREEWQTTLKTWSQLAFKIFFFYFNVPRNLKNLSHNSATLDRISGLNPENEQRDFIRIKGPSTWVPLLLLQNTKKVF